MQSIISYWFHTHFDMDTDLLGSMLMGANVVVRRLNALLSAANAARAHGFAQAGLSAIAAASFVARFGAINTMVITHLPSNVLLLLVRACVRMHEPKARKGGRLPSCVLAGAADAERVERRDGADPALHHFADGRARCARRPPSAVRPDGLARVPAPPSRSATDVRGPGSGAGGARRCAGHH
jgi:hypothetical protein